MKTFLLSVVFILLIWAGTELLAPAVDWRENLFRSVVVGFCLVALRLMWKLSARGRSLRRQYGVAGKEIVLRGPWVRGSHEIRPPGDWQGQSDFDCVAVCDRGIAFRSGLLWYRGTHFVIPWDDLNCSLKSQWDSSFDGSIIFRFEDPAEEWAFDATPEMLTALRDHGVLTA